MKEKQIRLFSWGMVVAVLSFVTVLNVFLASNFSLWGDELDAILPALRPWKGEQNFWWQIRQYIANPPGENLVLRGLYKLDALSWLRESSPELFWRLPYILVYTATGYLTYFYAEKWSRSSVIAAFALTIFLCSPGPFAWATETRFYSWAIFFMTWAVWQGILFIENGFRRRDLVILSLVTTVGVCFHISLALVCYLLFWFALTVLGKQIWTSTKKKAWPSRTEIYAILPTLFFGCLPYLVFKYAKRNWMFVPGGGGYGKVFKETVQHLVEVTPGQLAGLIPFGSYWSNGGCWIFLGALSVFIAYTFFRKNWDKLLVGVFLSALYVGGLLSVTLSGKANSFDVIGRYYLFVVPVVFATLTYVFFSWLRIKMEGVPAFFQNLLIATSFVYAISTSIHFARNNIHYGSPAKVNLDFAGLRDFYRSLPDRRNLVLLGVDDGEFIATTDDGAYIGRSHIFYLNEFEPYFVSSRDKDDQTVSRIVTNRKAHDFVFFGKAEKAAVLAGVDSKKMKCKIFRWDSVKLCRF